MTELSDIERAVRRENAQVRGYEPATLDEIGFTMNRIAGQQRRHDNRFVEMFRDLDLIRAVAATQDERLKAIEEKLDRLLDAAERSD